MQQYFPAAVSLGLRGRGNRWAASEAVTLCWLPLAPALVQCTCRVQAKHTQRIKEWKLLLSALADVCRLRMHPCVFPPLLLGWLLFKRPPPPPHFSPVVDSWSRPCRLLNHALSLSSLSCLPQAGLHCGASALKCHKGTAGSTACRDFFPELAGLRGREEVTESYAVCQSLLGLAGPRVSLSPWGYTLSASSLVS